MASFRKLPTFSTLEVLPCLHLGDLALVTNWDLGTEGPKGILK